jgi:hypothetical protein
MTLYRKQDWDPKRVVFVCFDLFGHEGSSAEICIGAAEVRGEFTYGWARADRAKELNHSILARPHPRLLETLTGPDGEWRFARRPWAPAQPDEDISWALERLEDATEIWTSDVATFVGGHADLARTSNATIEEWLAWWRDPRRRAAGEAEAGRDPVDEVRKLELELERRRTAGWDI